MFTAANYTIYFKHHRPKSGKGTPKGTTCSIFKGIQPKKDKKKDLLLLGTASSKPVSEVSVTIDHPSEIPYLGKRLRKIYKLEDGRRVAVMSGDNFSYSKGRKEALTKALVAAGIPRHERKAIWKEYKSNFS